MQPVKILALITAGLLAAFIGWRFVSNISNTDAAGPDVNTAVPLAQKAVLQQAEERMHKRLDALSLQGLVAAGMDSEQVRAALGEPVRVFVDSSKTSRKTIWWYEHRPSRRVVFGPTGRVIDTGK